MAALTQDVLSAQILQVGGKAVFEERKACFLAITLRRSKPACYWTECDSLQKFNHEEQSISIITKPLCAESYPQDH